MYRSTSHPLQMPMEVACLLLLCVNCVLEARDVLAAVRVMRMMDYFGNVWNYLDLGHFYLMWAGLECLADAACFMPCYLCGDVGAVSCGALARCLVVCQDVMPVVCEDVTSFVRM